MTWQPGQRVVTEQDHSEWREWRNERKRVAQRHRRDCNPRIDYYPDKAAYETISALVSRKAGGDFSSVINRIVAEWAEMPPE